MSTESSTTEDDSEERSLADTCEAIATHDKTSDKMRHLAEGLLDAIESGDIDAN